MTLSALVNEGGYSLRLLRGLPDDAAERYCGAPVQVKLRPADDRRPRRKHFQRKRQGKETRLDGHLKERGRRTWSVILGRRRPNGLLGLPFQSIL